MGSLRIWVKKKLIWFIGLILIIFLLTILPSWGNQFQASQTITIGPDIVRNDDIYLAGETINIEGTIKGDAVVAGRWITINGTVEGDIIAAGQTIAINGKAGDDVRLAAQVLQIGENAQISDDAIAAGFSLETKANSSIGGNLNFLGAQALLTGKIAKNLQGAMGALELRGRVERDVELIVVGDDQINPTAFGRKSSLSIPDISPGLTLTDSANIGGKLSYKSPREATIAEGAQVNGPIEYNRIEIVTQPTVTEIVIAQLRRLVALTLIGWLWFKFLPHGLLNLATMIKNRPWPSLGWGIVTLFVTLASAIVIFIGIYILVFFLAISLPNLIFPVLSLSMLAYFTLLIGLFIFISYLSPIVVSFLGGSWLLQKINLAQNPKPLISWILGLVILVILSTIPIFGSLLNLLIALWALGALWLWSKQSIYEK